MKNMASVLVVAGGLLLSGCAARSYTWKQRGVSVPGISARVERGCVLGTAWFAYGRSKSDEPMQIRFVRIMNAKLEDAKNQTPRFYAQLLWVKMPPGHAWDDFGKLSGKSATFCGSFTAVHATQFSKRWEALEKLRKSEKDNELKDPALSEYLDLVDVGNVFHITGLDPVTGTDTGGGWAGTVPANTSIGITFIPIELEAPAAASREWESSVRDAFNRGPTLQYLEADTVTISE